MHRKHPAVNWILLLKFYIIMGISSRPVLCQHMLLSCKLAFVLYYCMYTLLHRYDFNDNDISVKVRLASFMFSICMQRPKSSSHSALVEPDITLLTWAEGLLRFGSALPQYEVLM